MDGRLAPWAAPTHGPTRLPQRQTAAMGEMTKLIYVDDSGSVDHGGLIVYGWVEVSPVHWRTVLRTWLDLRKLLFTDYGIPVSQELHSTDFINGRGRVSVAPPARLTRDHPSPGTVMWKDLGREVAQLCLETLMDCPNIRVGSVYRWSGAKGADYARERYDVYAQLVEDFDQELRIDDSYGFVTMDGQDIHYRAAHRALKLDTRHVIEDPAYHDSKHSQWTQMADLVAYTANLHLNRHPGNAFGWTWFDHYLAGSDASAGPRLLPPTTSTEPGHS